MTGYIYLASPFWSESEIVRFHRYAKVKSKTAQILQAGHSVYSPIVHAFYLHYLLPEAIRHSHDFWLSHDFPLLHAAETLWIYQIEGWRESKGIAREIRFAEQLHIPIYYLGEFDVIPTTINNKDSAEPTAARVRPTDTARAR
jgi:nucleoside 2-deoxyribosyltransferase